MPFCNSIDIRSQRLQGHFERPRQTILKEIEARQIPSGKSRNLLGIHGLVLQKSRSMLQTFARSNQK